jgi:integrase
MIMCSQIPIRVRAFHDIKRSFHTACRMVGIENVWWHDLRATFCTRLALARYEALTIMMLMGHKDLKTTMRYIRAVQLQRSTFRGGCPQLGHK